MCSECNNEAVNKNVQLCVDCMNKAFDTFDYEEMEKLKVEDNA